MVNPCKCGLGTMYVCSHYNLKVFYPLVASEWHPDNNGPAESYSPTSGKKVKWRCLKDHCGCHEWECKISNRTSLGYGCPYCSGKKKCVHTGIAATHPHLLSEWDYSLNSDNPQYISACSHVMAWWKCAKNPCGCHLWQARVEHRTQEKSGCPFCAGQCACQHNNLLLYDPNIINSWDYERNALGPEKYLRASNIKVHWRCEKNANHRWMASISSRTCNDANCPICNTSKGERENHPK